MNNAPLVSAIVTTHNRIALLPRALDSVAVQTYPNIELIVVDDGSEKKAQSMIERYSQVLPVQYIRNELAQGACRARNQGIEAASGVFVAGLDDDDEWHKKRIAKMMQGYADEYAFVTSDVRMMYASGARRWRKKREISLDDLLYTNVVGNQGLVKKERLLTVGGFDETLEAAQDYDLWIRLALRFGTIKNVQQPLQNVYVQHAGQRISTPAKQLQGYLRFYQKHKSHMSRSQRKYQLYNIRKAMGKVSALSDMLGWVPSHRYWKELKWWLTDKFMS